MDTDRYLALFKRQRQKLEYARKLVPLFEECVSEIGRFASSQEIARWLQERGVPPSANAKPDAKWVAQTVQDFLYCDGIEPTEDAVRLLSHRTEGMRVKIVREFRKAECHFDYNLGEGARAHLAEKLAVHLSEIKSTASAVRAALGKRL